MAGSYTPRNCAKIVAQWRLAKKAPPFTISAFLYFHLLSHFQDLTQNLSIIVTKIFLPRFHSQKRKNGHICSESDQRKEVSFHFRLLCFAPLRYFFFIHNWLSFPFLLLIWYPKTNQSIFFPAFLSTPDRHSIASCRRFITHHCHYYRRQKWCC